MHILGNTLTEIAYQKAGIVKENSNTVIFKSQPEIDNVFITECKKKDNNLHIINNSEIVNYYYDNDFQYFDYKNIQNIAVNLKGKVQVKNACLCMEAFDILNKLGYHVSIESIKKGLKTVVHRARMEKLNSRPLIIYDGAHNVPAIKNLQDTIKMYYENKQRIYIISILKRKDYNKMLQLVSEDKNAEFILTSGNNQDTYTSSEELYKCMKEYVSADRIHKKNLNSAIIDVMNGNQDAVTFIIGSFYTYGTVTNVIREINSSK